MTAITKKRETDRIFSILTKFGRTDDSRYDETWIGNMYDQIRAALIIKEFQATGQIDQTWLTDLGLYTFNPVNFADDPTVNYCCTDISKAVIPNVVSVASKDDPNIDLGIYALISACGTKEYTPFPLGIWKMIPAEHIRSKFNYYHRINNALYVNKTVTKLRIVAILASPEDGYIVNSSPVLSGSIVSGTVYIVKGGQIIYNNVVRMENSTFTGGGTATYTGNGVAYLNTPKTALTDSLAYPVNADMARMIALEMLTKEFKLEAGQVIDLLNDSKDDAKN